MRITSSRLQSRILRDLQTNLSSLSQAQAQISSGRRMEKFSDVPIAEHQRLANSDVLTGLHSISTQLGTDRSATIRGTLTALDTRFARTQAILATPGARVGQINSAVRNSDTLSANLKLRRRRDIEEASTRLISLQTTLHASLQAASRILNMTLTD